MRLSHYINTNAETKKDLTLMQPVVVVMGVAVVSKTENGNRVQLTNSNSASGEEFYFSSKKVNNANDPY